MSQGDLEAARQQVIRFAKEYWLEHRSVLSVRLILKSCDQVKSSRHLYSLFPGRMAGVCKLAGVPPPEERLRGTEKAALVRRQGGTEESGAKLEAMIFELLDKRTPLVRIVSRLGHSDLVEESYKRWRRLKEADVNQPIVLRELRGIRSELSHLKNHGEQLSANVGALEKRVRVLETNFNACFTVRQCAYCRARTPVPRTAKSYSCINCGKLLGQTYAGYSISSRGGRVEFTAEFPNPPI